MKRRSIPVSARPVLGKALCLALIALAPGCGSPRIGGARPAQTANRSSQPDSPESEAESEQRIETMAHFATGLSYDLNNESDQARQQYVEAAEADPGYEPVVIEAVRHCLRDKQPDKAIDLLLDATAQPGGASSGSLYAWLGLAYAQAGKLDLSIAASRTAIRKAPQSLAAYQNLAQVYLQTNRTNEALSVLDDAARQPGSNPAFLIDLAELYLRFAQAVPPRAAEIQKRAKDTLDRATDLSAASPIEVLRIADAYFALGQLSKAEPLYRQLLVDHPDLPNLRSRLVDIYLRSGDKKKAAQQLNALIQDDPTNPQTYLVLGAIEVDDQQLDGAATHFERAIQLDPDLEQVYYDLAALKVSRDKPAEALIVLDKARGRFKRSFPMEFYSGVAYNELKNYPEALRYFTSAEAIGKASEPARLNHLFYFQLGAVYERSGHLEDAEKAFRECLRQAPDDVEALNYLGYMWAEHGTHLNEARQMIEKAVRLSPDSAAFLDSLAWVLYKQNQPTEALPVMLKAVEHSPKPDATLYDHLGDIYAALKQMDKAREAWTQSVELEPNSEVQKKISPSVSSAQGHP